MSFGWRWFFPSKGRSRKNAVNSGLRMYDISLHADPPKTSSVSTRAAHHKGAFRSRPE